MRENPQLDEWVVHDLNSDPHLPFETGSFDTVVVTVSIQYMTRPVEVFSEVRRILKNDGAFYVIYSNRMFPTKAVAIWHNLNDNERAQLIASYFVKSEGWSQPTAWDVSLKLNIKTDPVFIVSANKLRFPSEPSCRRRRCATGVGLVWRLRLPVGGCAWNPRKLRHAALPGSRRYPPGGRSRREAGITALPRGSA